MELYHRDIRLPDGFTLPARLIMLKYTAHALRAMGNDRYGQIAHIPIINLGKFEPVEVGVENGLVQKVVVRGEYNDTLDVVFVLIPHQPTRDTWTVKTVWLNEANDSHKTLDRSKYVR
jgi:hypothetical protein